MKMHKEEARVETKYIIFIVLQIIPVSILILWIRAAMKGN